MQAATAAPVSWSTRLSRLIDIRRDEVPAAVQAFALLLLIISAHTVLETARDALLITRLPSRSLGIVYVAVAVCVLPASALASRLSARLGARWALGGALLTAAVVLNVLFLIPTTPASVVGLYVASGLIGAVVVPQFWSLVGAFFTVAQARRLLGSIAAAGVLGASLGSASAAGLLMLMRVKGLLLVTAGLLVAVTIVLLLSPRIESRSPPVPDRAAPMLQSSDTLRHEPFLRRIALMVVVSTAAALAIDYFFKWTVARDVEPHHVAQFVARYYAVLNGLSLVTQVFVSGALVRKVGVTTAAIVTPLLLAMGAVGALVFNGALAAVLVLRGTDGALLNSVHRVTTELVYLPVAPAARTRAKPFIDGALARTTQALCGAALLALGAWLSPRIMATAAVVLTVAWVAVAVTTRRPYLDLLRRAISTLRPEPGADPIDLESASSLVQLLAHDDPAIALGAMNALARRGRERLIPALILLHEDEKVVVRALALFAASQRQDWVARAGRLLHDPRNEARIAAARALAAHGQLDLADLAQDASPRVRGYVALRSSLGNAGIDPADDPAIAEILERTGVESDDARLGILAAVADVDPDRRTLRVLLALADGSPASREWTEGLARAVASQHATALIPDLIARLPLRDGRETLRGALASLGAPAVTGLWSALRDRSRERSLRIHLPGSIARFGTRQVAEQLLGHIEAEEDGLVRYKTIRALQRLVVEKRIQLDRVRLEKLVRRNVLEHFRLLGLHAAFEGATFEEPTERLLVRLLEDKLNQSLERAFRLLQIAYPREDLRRVLAASRSADRRTRANAAEFVDALLRDRDERPLSALLRLAIDNLTAAMKAERGSQVHGVAPAPRGREAALEILVRDADATVAALAQLHAAARAGAAARVAIGRGQGPRPPLQLETLAPVVRLADG